MKKPDPRSRDRSDAETATAALSPAARTVGAALASWRVRIAETQTLARLTLSLLQGPTAMTTERHEQLGRLVAIEERTLAQLPRLDLGSLRSTTNARESGIDLRGPDTVIAEHHLNAMRDGVRTELDLLAAQIPQGVLDLGARIDGIRRTLDDLARAIDLLEMVLYPRMNNPAITVGQALDRAASSRTQTVTAEGDVDTHVEQVRGLFRLLSEVIATSGDNAYVHASREGGWVYLSVAPMATAAGHSEPEPGRVEILRLAAYLLRVQADRVEGGWRLALVAQN